jgi:hypothetical protein
MRLRPLRLALHVVAATALAGGGVLLTGSPGSAADAARPESFGGAATASSLHYAADRNPQPTPVSDAFHAEVPYATTSFDSSGTASATAASLYPGAGPLGVPALLCQFDANVCKIIKQVPRYPFIATAEYPTKPDDAATLQSGTIKQDPLFVTPQETVAHADENVVEARTETGGAGIAGAISVGSAVSHSKQAFEGSTLVVSAESVVRNLDLGGGQLHIDNVRSIATGKVNGGTVTEASATTTVSGATAGGVPVTIDSDGVHVAGNGDGGAANAAVNTALGVLDASGIQVRLLTPNKLIKGGGAAASTGGLLISMRGTVALPNPPPVPLPPQFPGIPAYNGDYFGSVTVAGAGVRAFAAPGVELSVPTLDVPVGAPALSGTTSGPVGSAPVGAAPPALTGAAPATAGAPARSAAATQSQPAAVLGVDLSSKRLKTLALILLAYPLLVLLTAPLRAPARIPRL